MIRFGCPTCQHVLETPPDQGGNKVRCPQCGQRIRVPTRADLDKTIPGKLLLGTVASGGTSLGPGEASAKNTPPAAVQAPPPADPKLGKWYIVIKGKRQGPYSGSQLTQMLGGGQLKGTDLVWTEGMPKWEAAKAVADRFHPSAEAPRPAPQPAPVRPLPQSPVKPAAPRKGRPPLGLAIGGAGALTAVLGVTLGVILLGNKGDTTTEASGTTPVTTATPTDLPLEDLTARARPSLARVHAGNSPGTGFLVGPEKYVATAWQPLADTPSSFIQVSSPGGPPMTRSPAPADIIYINPRAGFALLRVNTTATALPLAAEFTPTAGEAVGLATFPDSGPDAEVKSVRVEAPKSESGLTWVPLRGPLPPGFAGAPLLNARGEVVGVATAFKQDGRAVSLADLRKAVDDIQKASPEQKAVQAMRHDAAVLLRRYQRFATVYLDHLDDLEKAMQAAGPKDEDIQKAFRDQNARARQALNEVADPVKQAESVYSRLLDNQALPETLRQPLVSLADAHRDIRKQAEQYEYEKGTAIEQFNRQKVANRKKYQMARDQLQARLDLPSLD